MAIKNSWASGEVLTAADLTDTMKGVYINAQTSTSFTFGTADGFVTLSNASGGTATIPANSTAAFNTGAVIGVMNAGTAGSFTIGTAAGVTLNAVGTAVSQVLSIDAIEHRIGIDRHFVTFTMSEATTGFVLDSATFGVLNSNQLGF